jgi:hypothetical protein
MVNGHGRIFLSMVVIVFSFYLQLFKVAGLSCESLRAV